MSRKRRLFRVSVSSFFCPRCFCLVVLPVRRLETGLAVPPPRPPACPPSSLRAPSTLDGCLFPSLARGVVDDVTDKTARLHWLLAEPRATLSNGGRGTRAGEVWCAHAPSLDCVFTCLFVIHPQGHESIYRVNK